jgi:hypothetical protein
MHALLSVLDRSEEFQGIAAGLVSRGDRVCIEGASGAGKSLLVAGILREWPASAVVITYNDEHAGRLADDLSVLLADEPDWAVLRYPSITETIYDGPIERAWATVWPFWSDWYGASGQPLWPALVR